MSQPTTLDSNRALNIKFALEDLRKQLEVKSSRFPAHYLLYLHYHQRLSSINLLVIAEWLDIPCNSTKLYYTPIPPANINTVAGAWHWWEFLNSLRCYATEQEQEELCQLILSTPASGTSLTLLSLPSIPAHVSTNSTN